VKRSRDKPGYPPTRQPSVVTVPPVPSTSAWVAELVGNWLTAKRALDSAEQAEKGHSDRARRADLARWALVIAEAKGDSPTDDAPAMATLRLERMVAAAKENATGRQRMYWPARDVALVRFLASTGARAEETCAVTIGEVDRRAERPIWRVGKSKGDKARDVPLPKTTVAALDEWLAERVRPAEGRRALTARRASPLFVRSGRQPLLTAGPRPPRAGFGPARRGGDACRRGGARLPPPLRGDPRPARGPPDRHLPGSRRSRPRRYISALRTHMT
jgi:integrase